MEQIDKIQEQLDYLNQLAENERDKPTDYNKTLELSIMIVRLDRIILHFEECITGG